MKIARTWEMTYAHDRRKHRHRCFACRRIVEAGERVFMARMHDARTTRVAHMECADRIAIADLTYRALMTAHANGV